jgi:hypothetical protein
MRQPIPRQPRLPMPCNYTWPCSDTPMETRPPANGELHPLIDHPLSQNGQVAETIWSCPWQSPITNALPYYFASGKGGLAAALDAPLIIDNSPSRPASIRRSRTPLPYSLPCLASHLNLWPSLSYPVIANLHLITASLSLSLSLSLSCLVLLPPTRPCRVPPSP